MEIPSRDVAGEAQDHQGSGKGYGADDDWVNIVLEPGFLVWRGVGGGYSPYHIGPNYMGGMLGNTPSAEFWQSAQVRAHKDHGYRTAVAEYEVLCSTAAAHGTATDNWKMGWGGAEQYFIPEDLADNLAPTGRVHHF